MPTLEARAYVATPSDIEAVTKNRISASVQADRSVDTYLKCLAATTISELGETPRVRSSKPGPGLAEDDIKQQLTALEAVHIRFYQVIIKTYLGHPNLGTQRNRKSLAQKKATWARTSKSLLRSWIKTGHDIRSRPVNQFTKPLLQKELPETERPGNPSRLKRRAVGLADRIIGLAGDLAKKDSGAATEALEAVMNLLGRKLTEMGAKTTTKADVAMREGLPFRRGSTVFWPVTPQDAAASEAPVTH